MNAVAPGKVILSGEHSVVYGAPAIALAVSESIAARFLPTGSTSVSIPENTLAIDSGSGPCGALALSDLDRLKVKLDQRYTEFEAGQRAVETLLDRSDDLLLYALAQIGSCPAGIVQTSSTLPTGSGMGSSAAAIAATLTLAEQLSGNHLTQAERFERVRYCERLQHGRGSAIDAAAVTYGGLVRVQGGAVQRLDCHLGKGWFRVQTGRPSVTTGQCVAAVREQKFDAALWQQFADITDQLPDALQDQVRLISLLRQNHRLLDTIGVVPAKVRAFIEDVEALGGAAKISGAGAHQGDAGGLVLCYLPDGDLTALCDRYQYSLSSLTEDSQGARCV